ncbi:hypothetical protein [Mycolicibacterium sp.]|uniref:hypothetical protein n=1 Tax=Mycolicibacterium sp. TaxID=2320850 RepID=UPI001A349BFE|nr:hypothetical protein [Mycolicibacterium sp.]MBJ7400836.1 hypothetical protein [Mycolicibacterium sp.]
MQPHPPTHEVTGLPPVRAAHAARPPVATGPVVIGIASALVITAVALGVGILVTSAGPSTSTPTSARLITITPATTSVRP